MDEGVRKDGLGFLPPRNEEVTVMVKKGESELKGLNEFLIDVINPHLFWNETDG